MSMYFDFFGVLRLYCPGKKLNCLRGFFKKYLYSLFKYLFIVINLFTKALLKSKSESCPEQNNQQGRYFALNSSMLLFFQ